MHTEKYTGLGPGNRSPVTAVLPVGLYCFECEVLECFGGVPASGGKAARALLLVQEGRAMNMVDEYEL